MKITRVGLDLAKQVIQLHAVDDHEQVVCRRALQREELLRFFPDRAPCLIGMEACAGAHHWARELTRLGHTVRLMAAHHVKPYVQGQKNDANDAAAICEAVGRPTMRFVPMKTVAQQDAQALHRIRSEQVACRTAKVNQIRGLLCEYGIVLAQGRATVRRALPRLLEDGENGLTGDFRELLQGLYDDLVALDERIHRLDTQVERHASQSEQAQRLRTIPGVGPLTASALSAAVGDAKHFKNGRQMAAWLGLTPRQRSSGGKTRLLGIHKRGDSYLRGLLVHGARSVQRLAMKKDDQRSRWLNALEARRHRNIAIVAQANKTARIAWAVMAREEVYRIHPTQTIQ